MPKEPQPQSIDSTPKPSGLRLSRRSFLGTALAVASGVAIGLSGESPRPARAQAEIADDFSDPSISLFPERTQGNGFRSRIENGALVVEATEGGTGIATATSKEPLPAGKTTMVEATSTSGMLIGRGTSADYIRALVARSGEVRFQQMTREGGAFKAVLLGSENLGAELAEGPHNLSLFLGDGNMKLRVGERETATTLPDDLVEKYSAGPLVLGAAGNPKEVVTATFKNIKASA